MHTLYATSMRVAREILSLARIFILVERLLALGTRKQVANRSLTSFMAELRRASGGDNVATSRHRPTMKDY